MRVCFVLFVAFAAAAQQYTVTLSQSAGCVAPTVTLPLTLTCVSYTSPSNNQQWSWRLIGPVSPTVLSLMFCEGSLDCSGSCGTQDQSINSCSNWNAASTNIEILGATTTTTTTATTSTTTAPSSGGGKCFHKDTTIFYENQVLDMQDPGPCRVTHVLENVKDGLVIRATFFNDDVAIGEWVLRVTGAHLVYTRERGLVRADELRPNEDVLYSSYGVPVKVQSVTRESEPQTYFGFNCPHGSIVYANGIKVSTFDTLHALPAVWMRVASSIVGIDRASRWGDAIAGWAQRVGIV